VEKPLEIRAAEPTVELTPNVAAPVVRENDQPDLKTARQLAREIGKKFFENEEYDIPTFLRRPHDG
jgi:hypothetical protein